MLTAIIRYLSGYLLIRIEGYSPERFLNLCRHHRIYLWNLRPLGHAYEMNISVRGFRRLKPILRKTRTRIYIKERRGFPFFLHKYRKRKIFFCGILFCMVSIYILSLFVWNIHIDGNQARTDEVLLEFLENKGIVHGMPKSKVDCEKIVRDIRKEYDDIIWVSAYVKGTRLMIQVKENTDRSVAGKKEEEDIKEPPVDIAADKDGVILSMVTRKGVPAVHEGDEIKKGDILVSGTVEVKNDAGETIDYQYQEADAEIIVRTECHYEDIMQVSYEEKKWTGKKKYRFWLETANNIYTIGSAKNSYHNFCKETKQKRFCMGEHFWLPFSFGVETVREYEPEAKKYTQKECQELLTVKFRKFCQDLEKKGVQILENNVKIYSEGTQAAARGTLILAEPAGEKQAAAKQEIPEINPDEGQEGN